MECTHVVERRKGGWVRPAAGIELVRAHFAHFQPRNFARAPIAWISRTYAAALSSCSRDFPAFDRLLQGRSNVGRMES